MQVRVGDLTEMEKADLGLDLVRLKTGVPGSAEFWGETRDGREVHIQYRRGCLSIDIDDERLAVYRHGPNLHDLISIGQVCDLLGLTVAGERLPVTLPERDPDWAGQPLLLGPGVVYWYVHVNLTEASVAAVMADLAERWPDAVLRGWDYDHGRPRGRPYIARNVPITDVATLPSNPFSTGSDGKLWQDVAACDSGTDLMIAGQAGTLAVRIEYWPWKAKPSHLTPSPNPLLIQASEAPDDLPVALPPEGEHPFILEMSARLDDPVSRTNLEAVDAILACHLVPVTWWTHYGGRPDETRPHQTWAGRDIVEWCARAPHHAATAQKGRAKDREMVWTWTRVTPCS